MDKTFINDVLKFIRVDGYLDAPICFLTNEDGDWNDEILEEETLKDLNDDPVWIPTDDQRPLDHHDTGKKVGPRLSRIMVDAYGDIIGGFHDWKDYRNYLLYGPLNSNIKYYPIGKKSNDTWMPWLVDKYGLTKDEYYRICREERPTYLKKLFQKNDDPRLFIICANYAEWSEFIEKYVYPDLNIKIEKYDGFSFATNKDAPNELLFARFDIFLWRKGKGGVNNKITEFSKILREKTPDKILKRLSSLASE